VISANTVCTYQSAQDWSAGAYIILRCHDQAGQKKEFSSLDCGSQPTNPLAHHPRQEEQRMQESDPQRRSSNVRGALCRYVQVIGLKENERLPCLFVGPARLWPRTPRVADQMTVRIFCVGHFATGGGVLAPLHAECRLAVRLRHPAGAARVAPLYSLPPRGAVGPVKQSPGWAFVCSVHSPDEDGDCPFQRQTLSLWGMPRVEYVCMTRRFVLAAAPRKAPSFSSVSSACASS